jgi:hypothetical protein
MPLEMNPVYSSHVDAVGYDPVSQQLHVRWQTGKVSVYSGVPPEVGADLHKRASIGEALKSVKAQYRHSYG